jgi:hypothetical protein
VGGTTCTWPATGGPDNVIADGQIIDVSGSGTELGFLGAGAFGEASGDGTITYTDSSQQRGRERGERDAHLRDSHRVRHGDWLSGLGWLAGRAG